MTLDTKTLMPCFGAEISGYDFNAAPNGETTARIRRALLDHHLLVFRGRELSPAEQVAFSSLFGGLETFPPDATQVAGHPQIFRLANHSGDGYENVGMYWHSDGSFLQHPTAVSIFHVIAVPEDGGDTLYADLASAYETLPEDVRRRFDHLKTLHRNGIVHPLVLPHPATGRKALYVNLGLTAGVLGQTGEESRATLASIREHLDRPGTFYRHHWRPGDVVVADNFAVAHQATPVDRSRRRVLHRTTVGGPFSFWHREKIAA